MSRFALSIESLFDFLSWKIVKIQINQWSPILSGKLIILKNRSKLGYNNWLVSLLFATIEIQTRTLSKGQTATVLFIYLRIFFPHPTPLKIRFGEGMRKYLFWCLVLVERENSGILVKIFGNNIISTEKFKFFACQSFFVIQW